MHTRELNGLFAPKSIAVVGATDREGSVGGSLFRNLLLNGYQGVAYPVNLRAQHVASVKTYPSLSAIDGPVDLAVLAVPPTAVIAAIEECGKHGTKNAIVITAGFKEIGPEGAEIEKNLKQAAIDNGVSVMGPNCLGLINTDPAVSMNASFAREMPNSGNLAFVSQSGALCTAVLDYAADRKIGFSKFVSFGNKCDLDEVDLLGYLADDPQTDVILMYLEDLSRGRAFLDLAREITGEREVRKPILAIKTGRTARGAAAAASHTGSLAGADEVYEAFFAQAGVLRVDTVEDLFDFAIGFANQPMPKGNRVAIVTNAGGPAIMTADACVRHGLDVPPLSAATQEALAKVLPPTANVKNPVDVIGDARHDRYRDALTTTLTEPDIDALLVLITPQNMTDVPEIAAEIAAVEAGQPPESAKPILTALMGSVAMHDGARILTEKGVPWYSFPESAVRTLSKMAAYHDWTARRRTDYTHYPVDKEAVRRIIEGAQADGRNELPEIESLEVLRAYGFPTPQFGQGRSPSEAVEIADRVGYPVVLKISSPDILHKTDVGGVKLDLKDADEVRAAADEIIRLARAAKPDARIWGVTVEPMAKKGLEVILGMTRDPNFGPIVMFGLGGIWTEVLKDVAFRLAPVRELGPERMLASIRAQKMLDGARGSGPVDRHVLYEAIGRLSQLVMDFPEIKEMDINPFIAYEAGQGGVAVDARVILETK